MEANSCANTGYARRGFPNQSRHSAGRYSGDDARRDAWQNANAAWDRPRTLHQYLCPANAVKWHASCCAHPTMRSGRSCVDSAVRVLNTQSPAPMSTYRTWMWPILALTAWAAQLGCSSAAEATPSPVTVEDSGVAEVHVEASVEAAPEDAATEEAATEDSCVPSCGPGQCGSDGCGGTCPACSSWLACDDLSSTCKSRARQMVPLPDGVSLRTELSLPTSMSGPVSTVLLRTPYCISLGNANMSVFSKFNNLGYAFVMQCSRGTGGSEGTARSACPGVLRRAGRRAMDSGAALVQWFGGDHRCLL